MNRRVQPTPSSRRSDSERAGPDEQIAQAALAPFFLARWAGRAVSAQTLPGSSRPACDVRIVPVMATATDYLPEAWRYSASRATGDTADRKTATSRCADRTILTARAHDDKIFDAANRARRSPDRPRPLPHRPIGPDSTGATRPAARSPAHPARLPARGSPAFGPASSRNRVVGMGFDQPADFPVPGQPHQRHAMTTADPPAPRPESSSLAPHSTTLDSLPTPLT